MKLFDLLRSKFSIFFNCKKRYSALLLVALLFVAAGLILPAGFVHAGPLDWLGDQIMNQLVYRIVYLIFLVLLGVAYLIAKIGALFISYNLNPAMVMDVLESPGIYQGWQIFRDIANLLYILILLLIALGTIFRSDTYNAKKLLPKLIIVAFLLNFSMMLTEVVIDFGNILMYGILKMMCAPGVDPNCFQDFYSQVMSSIDALYNNYNLSGIIMINAQAAVGIAVAFIYILLYGLVLVALGFFLMIRIAVLAVLIILSPLAFFGMVAPGLKKISDQWWDKVISYSLFGPIFALLLYVSGLMAKTTLTMNPTMITSDPNLGTFGVLFATIIASIIPLIFLLAIIPITKGMGIMAADAVFKYGSIGLGVGAAGWLAGAADRFAARGAGMKGSDQKGWKGGLSRVHAWTRNKLSYASPGAIKRAYKAQKAEQEHDYDKATGKMRDTYSSTIERKKTHFEDIAGRNDVARRIKDFATENGDEIVDMFQDATDIRDQQVLLRMGAMQGKSYAIAATQENPNAAIDPTTGKHYHYTEDAAGYNKMIHDKIIPRMDSKEASKLFEDIGELEEKKGNWGLTELGHYDKATRKWATYNYTGPSITKNGATKTQEEWHREDIVKSVRRRNALNSLKDFRASSVVNANKDWTALGTELAPTFLTNEGRKHIGKLKPEEAGLMKIALIRKSAGVGLTPEETDLLSEINTKFP